MKSEMKKSNAYLFGFMALCTLAAAKLACAVTVIWNAVAYLANAKMESAWTTALIALLIDFALGLLMALLARVLKLWRRRTYVAVLCSPLLLLGVIVLSFVMLGMGTEAKGLMAMELVCWGLMFGYLILPDIFIALEFIRLRHGWPGETRPKTAYERIMSMKK